MPRRRAGREADTRQALAVAAARIMAEEGVRDFGKAKRKAADRLGVPPSASLPGNDEVQAALKDYLALFHQDLPQTLARLRRTALEAMELLAEFDPRLVGPVLEGTATQYTDVQLQATATNPEDLQFFFQEHGIEFEQVERRLRFGGERVAMLPTFRFQSADVVIEVVVFSPESVREAPLSAGDNRPMRRARVADVKDLLDGDLQPPSPPTIE